jgi:hypothetical protein
MKAGSPEQGSLYSSTAWQPALRFPENTSASAVVTSLAKFQHHYHDDGTRDALSWHPPLQRTFHVEASCATISQ